MAEYHSGNYSGKNPTWYWTEGLHDAQITKVERKNDSAWPWLRFTINSEGALFSKVNEITFLDFEIENNVSLNEKYYWWLEDKLTYEHGRYLLTLRLDTPKCKEIIVKIRFREAKVK